jgi:hypothetical protein
MACLNNRVAFVAVMPKNTSALSPRCSARGSFAVPVDVDVMVGGIQVTAWKR